METEQGTLAKTPKPGRGQTTLPEWLLDQLSPGSDGIEPLQSNALALRYDTLRPGPDLAMHWPEHVGEHTDILEPPSAAKRRLRGRLGEMVAAQAVENEAGRAGLRGGVAGPGLFHR